MTICTMSHPLQARDWRRTAERPASELPCPVDARVGCRGRALGTNWSHWRTPSWADDLPGPMSSVSGERHEIESDDPYTYPYSSNGQVLSIGPKAFGQLRRTWRADYRDGRSARSLDPRP